MSSMIRDTSVALSLVVIVVPIGKPPVECNLDS